MTPRRLLSLWLGVIGEMLIITADLIDPFEQYDQLAIDEIVQELARMVRR